jgi:hypothetical protein
MPARLAPQTPRICPKEQIVYAITIERGRGWWARRRCARYDVAAPDGASKGSLLLYWR